MPSPAPSSQPTSLRYLDSHVWNDGRTWRATVPLARGAGRKRLSSTSLDSLKTAIESVRLAQTSAEPFRPADLAALRAALDMLPPDLPLTEAVRLGIDAWKAARHDTSPLLSAVADEWLALVRSTGRRPRTIESYVTHLHKLEPLSGRTIASVAVADISPIISSLTPATAAGLRRVARALWSFAIRAGYADANPWVAIPKPRTDSSVPSIYSPAAVRAILAAAAETAPRFLPYLYLSFFTGIRPGAIQRLRPADIDAAHAQILVSPASDKLRRSYYAPIRPTLAAWLKACPPAFPLLPYKRKAAYLHIHAIFDAASVEFIPYGTRHTFASYALAAGSPPHAVAMDMGHFRDVTTLFNHYRALATPASAADFWSILPHNLSQRIKQGKTPRKTHRAAD